MATKRVGGKSLNDLIDQLLRGSMYKEALNTFSENACLLCKIFGAPTYRSKVTFQDSFPINHSGELTSVPTDIKMGIAVDRSTGAAYGGALYRVEYIEPGALFTLSISSQNLPNYALGLLVEVLMMLDEGLLRIGGFKSRGFGRVKLENISVKLKHYSPFSGNNEFLEALDNFDKAITVSPSEFKNGQLIYRDEQLSLLLKEFREAWRVYVASTSKG